MVTTRAIYWLARRPLMPARRRASVQAWCRRSRDAPVRCTVLSPAPASLQPAAYETEVRGDVLHVRLRMDGPQPYGYFTVDFPDGLRAGMRGARRVVFETTWSASRDQSAEYGLPAGTEVQRLHFGIPGAYIGDLASDAGRQPAGHARPLAATGSEPAARMARLPER
jgi:hypothetical protein